MPATPAIDLIALDLDGTLLAPDETISVRNRTAIKDALNAGIRGVVTLQGAPESHLGILSREFSIPCVMSTSFTDGIQTSRGETIPADGTRVRLDITGEKGQIFLLPS